LRIPRGNSHKAQTRKIAFVMISPGLVNPEIFIPVVTEMLDAAPAQA